MAKFSLSSIVAACTLIYGITITLTSLNIGSRMAEQKCDPLAVRANMGLLVMGGMLTAVSLGYLACSTSACANASAKATKGLGFITSAQFFSLTVMVISVLCISLAGIVEQRAGCIGATNVMTIWMPAIPALIVALFVFVRNVGFLNKMLPKMMQKNSIIRV